MNHASPQPTADLRGGYLPGIIRCVHGHWRGAATARLLYAGEQKLDRDPTAITNDYRWAKDELVVNAAQTDSEMHPWITFALPADAALAPLLPPLPGLPHLRGRVAAPVVALVVVGSRQFQQQDQPASFCARRVH